jgi:hypothetical protein
MLGQEKIRGCAESETNSLGEDMSLIFAQTRELVLADVDRSSMINVKAIRSSITPMRRKKHGDQECGKHLTL